jgi:hypothetical protein
MRAATRRVLILSAATIGLISAVSTYALAQAEPPARSIGNNESVFIDGKALTISQSTSRDDVTAQIAKLGARELGPGAIIFRANDRLYIVDVPPLPTYALNDPADRQRSYGGLYDRQQSYGGLSDADVDRLRIILNDPSIDRLRASLAEMAAQRQRSRSYGGLNDPVLDRQRSYGGMYDRQQSYGGLNDPGFDRQRSYGGMYDRQQSYGGMYDRDYANYRLKKTFDEVWGAGGTEKK